MALIRDGRVAEGQLRVDRILRRGDSAEGHFLLGAALFTAGNYPGAVDGACQGRRPESGRAVAAVLLRPGAALHRRRRMAPPRPSAKNSPPTRTISTPTSSSPPSWRTAGNPPRPARCSNAPCRSGPGSLEARDALANGFRVDQPGASRSRNCVGLAGAADRHARPEPPVEAHRAGVRQLHLSRSCAARRPI